jgi:hypothetical protein
VSASVLDAPRTSALARWRAAPLDSWWTLALLAVGALGLVAGVLIIDASPVGTYTDDALYVITARSIATGHGFRMLHLPGAPYATHFPPGYPLMLSVLWRIMPSFPDNVMLFKGFNALCLGVIAACTARYMHRTMGAPRLAVAVGAVTAVSVPLFFLGTMLLSELSFLALLLLLLPSLEQFAAERAPLWKAIALGVAVGACALVRTHGFVLAPAMGFVLVTRGRWRDAFVVVAAAIVTMLPWQLWSARHTPALATPLLGMYGSYGYWWRLAYETFGPNIFARTLSRTVPETYATFAVLFSPVHTRVAIAFSALLLVLVVGMAVRAHWRRIAVTLMFLLGYLVILELWPGPPTRMIWGLWPLFLVLIAAGMREIIRIAAQRPRAVRYAAVAVAAWLVVGYGLYDYNGIRGQWWATLPRGAGVKIRGLVAWTRAYTKPSDIVATDAEAAVFLYSGRRTVPVRTFTADQFLADPPANVEVERGLVPLLAAYPVRAVITASDGSTATATMLTVPPRRLLAPAGQFPWGSAFDVLPR